MNPIAQLAPFAILDYAALALLLVVWIGTGWRIENPPATRPSVTWLMAGFRRNAMAQMVTRQPRVFDAQIIGIMRQGTAFFASATMIAIGGGLALMGETDRLAGIAQDLTQSDVPGTVLELKLLAVLLLLANAFLKFVWAHRLFGYCAVLMAAVPNDPDDAAARPRAAQAAEISITAARSFNRAMRSTYFALAASAWLLGPVALIVAAALTAGVLWRREFASQSRAILLKTPPDTQP